MIKASELTGDKRCTKRRTHEITLWGEKTPVANKPMACREVLQKYLYGKIKAVDIPAELATAFKKVGYVNSQQEAANLDEKTREIMRYVNAEEAERSHRHFIDPRELTINIFGTDVKVKPDAVCVDGNRIEVIKYKFKSICTINICCNFYLLIFIK